MQFVKVSILIGTVTFFSLLSCMLTRTKHNESDGLIKGGDVSKAQALPQYATWRDVITDDLIIKSESRLLNLTVDPCIDGKRERCNEGLSAQPRLKLKEIVVNDGNKIGPLPINIFDAGNARYVMILADNQSNVLSGSIGATLAGKGLSASAGIGLSAAKSNAASIQAGVVWGFDAPEQVTLDDGSKTAILRPWFQCWAGSNVSNTIRHTEDWHWTLSASPVSILAELPIIGNILQTAAGFINANIRNSAKNEISASLESQWDLFVRSNKYLYIGDSPATQFHGKFLMKDFCSLWLSGKSGTLDPDRLTEFSGDTRNLFKDVKDFNDSAIYAFNFPDGELGKALIATSYFAYETIYLMPYMAKERGQELKDCDYDENYRIGDPELQGLSEDIQHCTYEWLKDQVTKQMSDDAFATSIVGKVNIELGGLKPYCKQNRPSMVIMDETGTKKKFLQRQGHCVVVQTRRNYPCELWRNDDGSASTRKPHYIYSERKLNYASVIGAGKTTPLGLPPLIYRVAYHDYRGNLENYNNLDFSIDPDQPMNDQQRSQMSRNLDYLNFFFDIYYPSAECLPTMQCSFYDKSQFESLTAMTQGPDGFEPQAAVCK